MFKHGYRWGYLKTNPAEFVDRPKTVRPEIEVLNQDEVGRLLTRLSGFDGYFNKNPFNLGARVSKVFTTQ
jgi:hypothetical protein